MAYLGIPGQVPIWIAEVGYQDDPSVASSVDPQQHGDPQAQADSWARVLDTVYANRRTYNVTRIFVFTYIYGGGFGIVDDEENPRPAYSVIKSRIPAYDPARGDGQ